MKPIKKRKNVFKFYWDPDQKLLKEATQKGNLEKGLKALDSLWKRGINFQELEGSFYFSWLSYANWNVINMAKYAKLHRNTVIVVFRHSFQIRSIYNLRLKWKKIRDKKISFPEKVKIIYDQAGMKPRFSKEETKGMVNLWLMGVPWEVVRAHFVLWSMRQGRSNREISNILGIHGRSVHRYRAYALRPGSPARKWLEPLKVKNKEWFFQRGRN
jgi:hypothetical protein